MTASPRFSLGTLVATPGALTALHGAGMAPLPFLTRHASGDWGDLEPEDKSLNDQALQDGGRLFSAYRFGPRLKIWIITEADRSATTVLLPSEY